VGDSRSVLPKPGVLGVKSPYAFVNPGCAIGVEHSKRELRRGVDGAPVV
jgi:hypothetical protein